MKMTNCQIFNRIIQNSINETLASSLSTLMDADYCWGMIAKSRKWWWISKYTGKLQRRITKLIVDAIAQILLLNQKYEPN